MTSWLAPSKFARNLGTLIREQVERVKQSIREFMRSMTDVECTQVFGNKKLDHIRDMLEALCAELGIGKNVDDELQVCFTYLFEESGESFEYYCAFEKQNAQLEALLTNTDGRVHGKYLMPLVIDYERGPLHCEDCPKFAIHRLCNIYTALSQLDGPSLRCKLLEIAGGFRTERGQTADAFDIFLRMAPILHHRLLHLVEYVYENVGVQHRRRHPFKPLKSAAFEARYMISHSWCNKSEFEREEEHFVETRGKDGPGHLHREWDDDDSDDEFDSFWEKGLARHRRWVTDMAVHRFRTLYQ